MKKLLKYLAIFAASLLVVIALLTTFTQTPMFKNWLKRRAIALAQSYINGQIALKALQGNLFTRLELEGLSISQEGEQIIGVKRASLRYNLLALLSNRIAVSQFRLEEPNVRLVQREDKTWNIAALIKTADSTETATGDESGLNWDITLGSLQIDYGLVELRGIDSTQINVPREIRNLQLTLGFSHTENQYKLSLQNLRFETRRPDLRFEMVQSGVEVEQPKLAAKTEKIALKTTATLSAAAVEMQEFKIYGNPRLELTVAGSIDDLIAKIDLTVGGGQIKLWSQLKADTQPYQYHLKGNLSKINLAEITHRQELDSDLNLDVEISGEGIKWGEMNTQFAVTIDSGHALGKSFEAMIMNGDIQGDSLRFSGNLSALGATSVYTGKLVSTNHKTTYELNGVSQHLNLSSLLGDSSFASDLNFDLHLTGHGVAANTASGNLALNLSSSQINKIAIDSARVDLSLQDQRLAIKKFSFSSPIADITAAGALGLSKSGLLSFNIELNDLSRLSQVIPFDSLRGEGNVSGRINGVIDSLSIATNINFKHAGTPEMTIEEFDGSLSGLMAKSKSSLAFAGEAREIKTAAAAASEANFKLTYEDSAGSFDVHVKQRANLTAETNGRYLLKPQGYRLILEGLDIVVNDQRWRKVGNESTVDYTGSKLDVSQLVLASNGQTITALGNLDSAGTGTFRLQIDSLRLASLTALFKKPADYKGLLHLELTLSHTLAQPQISGLVSVINGRYWQEPFDKLSGRFGYNENEFKWNFLFSKTKDDSTLVCSGFLPFRLAFSPFISEPLEATPLQIKFTSSGADLAFLQGFVAGVKNFHGVLMADVVLQNTLKDLRGSGSIKFANGQFDMPELGTKYREINVGLQLQDKELIINDFHVKSGGGDLKIVAGSLSLSQQQIEKFSARFRANRFQVMNNKKLQAAVDGEIELSGSVSALSFKGNLRVSQARIYYPAWLEEETAVQLTDQPFFVIASDTAQFNPGGAIRFQKSAAGVETLFTETEFYKNLRGNLSLTFERNTWFRSAEANVEVEGQVELVKESADFVLFGALSSIRGYYALQGNRFDIVAGKINFKGDPAINPDLHIEAVYDFVDRAAGNSQTREIKVVIAGTKETPEFKFTLDGQEAEQKDIFSILLFGKPFDQLAVSQRSSIAGQAENGQTGLEEKAAGFLASQLIKRLGGKLGSELNLDVLQIESGEALGDTKVRVGKYVTSNVFVSVSQDFGAEGEQKVALEYEIPKDILFFNNFFIQAAKERTGSTALDFVWKIEW